jgi:hypothetical protein
MGLRIKKILREYKELGKYKGDGIRTTFDSLYDGTYSELLITTSIIVLLWILLTHTI